MAIVLLLFFSPFLIAIAPMIVAIWQDTHKENNGNHTMAQPIDLGDVTYVEERRQAVKEFVERKIQLKYWFCSSSNILTTIDYSEYESGDRKYYDVIFSEDRKRVIGIIPLENSYIEVEERSLSEKKHPENIRVHRKSAPLLYSDVLDSKTKFNEKSADAFFAEQFRENTDLLMRLGKEASESEDGIVTAYGADFNKQQLPEKRELKLITKHFKESGFLVLSVNYRTGEYELSLNPAN